MNLLPNRKARRELAKKLGLLEKKSKSTFTEKLEMTRRAIDTGKAIHRRNLEEQLRVEDKIASDKEANKLKDLIETGLTSEEALEQLKIK